MPADVAYPEPGSPAVTAVMKGNRKRDTQPELRLRSALHRSGLRFRKDYRIVTPVLAVRADIAFPRQRLAVFVDGCFWHGCPEHGTRPGRNAAYWDPKLARNQERDLKVTMALTRAGWTVTRAWEHENIEAVVQRVLEALTSSSRDEDPELP